MAVSSEVSSCDPSIWKIEAEELCIPGQPVLQNETWTAKQKIEIC